MPSRGSITVLRTAAGGRRTTRSVPVAWTWSVRAKSQPNSSIQETSSVRYPGPYQSSPSRNVTKSPRAASIPVLRAWAMPMFFSCRITLASGRPSAQRSTAHEVESVEQSSTSRNSKSGSALLARLLRVLSAKTSTLCMGDDDGQFRHTGLSRSKVGDWNRLATLPDSAVSKKARRSELHSRGR